MANETYLSYNRTEQIAGGKPVGHLQVQLISLNQGLQNEYKIQSVV